jgi:NADPH:quinone reductase-like Zn-dependent oxidoreductase
MKAIVWTKYGSPDGLQLQEVEKPSPKDNEVLIRIHAASVTAADCELRAFKGFSAFWLPLRIYIGLIRPTRIKILGQELAGEIESEGKAVTKFKAGDPVFAWSALCLGGYAEYICLSENAMMAIKPANITYAEAAVISVGGFEAWQYLKGNIQAGQKVLIVGAGGSIGTFGVQIAKHLGAEVTAVDSEGKFDMLRSIGADHMIDYTREDFTKSGQTYDVIFDAPGKTSFSRCRKLLKPNGQFLSANPGTSDQLRMALNLTTRRRLAAPENTSTRNEYFTSLRDLIAAGKIKSVIDRTYPLEQATEAHRYAETGQKKGNIVIAVVPNNKS